MFTDQIKKIEEQEEMILAEINLLKEEIKEHRVKLSKLRKIKKSMVKLEEDNKEHINGHFNISD